MCMKELARYRCTVTLGRPTLANRPWVHGRIRYANSMIPQGEVSTADEYTLCHGNRVIGGICIAL